MTVRNRSQRGSPRPRLLTTMTLLGSEPAGAAGDRAGIDLAESGAGQVTHRGVDDRALLRAHAESVSEAAVGRPQQIRQWASAQYDADRWQLVQEGRTGGDLGSQRGKIAV